MIDRRRVPLAEAASECEIVAVDAIEYGDLDKKYQQSCRTWDEPQ